MIDTFKEMYRDDIHRLVEEFNAESLEEYGISFDIDTLKGTVESLKHSGWLLVKDGKAVGVIAGKEVQTPYSNERIWHEVIWYVNKAYRRHGLKLLNAAKKMLKDMAIL